VVLQLNVDFGVAGHGLEKVHHGCLTSSVSSMQGVQKEH
jgi:hypothetical protein